MSNHLFDALLADRIHDDRPFMHFADGSQWSYADTLTLSARMANVLVANQVQPGDRVAVQVDKSPEAIALYFACMRSGAVMLPLNTAYTATELAYFIGDAEPTAVIVDGKRAAEITAIAGGATVLTLDADGQGSLKEQATKQPGSFETVPCAADDLAAILYTSGTTGRSKGAMLSHANLLSNAQVLQQYWQFTADDVLLHALPIFHTHGLFVATNITLVAGSAMIFLPKFDVVEAISLLPKATALMGVPTFYTRLLSQPTFTRELASGLRLFISGSAPLLAETHIEFEQRTGQRILERYGMTETNMNTSNPHDGERRAGTVGFPLPGVDLKICDPSTGEALAQGEIGVIEVRGPNVFKGYWRMPEKTAEELRADGFFITGDLGQIDSDGYVHIVGRGKDLIITGGFNVYPKEVETVIDAIDGVLESAVIGLPHPDFGEGVVAVVVPQPGAQLEEPQVIQALNEQLAKFKQPKRVLIIDELPRNTMGKVQKNILREQNNSLLSGGAA